MSASAIELAERAIQQQLNDSDVAPFDPSNLHLASWPTYVATRPIIALIQQEGPQPTALPPTPTGYLMLEKSILELREDREWFINAIIWHPDYGPLGFGEERHEGRIATLSPAVDAFIEKFWSFCGQKLTVESRFQPRRALRRELERTGSPANPEIRIINLRTKQYTGSGEEGEAEGMEWSCRWVVRGHWHTVLVGPRDNQTREVRWYAPYIKGPADKVLKVPGDIVFNVVR